MSGKLSTQSPEVRPQQREEDSRTNTLRNPEGSCGFLIQELLVAVVVVLLVPGLLPSPGNLCAFWCHLFIGTMTCWWYLATTDWTTEKGKILSCCSTLLMTLLCCGKIRLWTEEQAQNVQTERKSIPASQKIIYSVISELLGTCLCCLGVVHVWVLHR